MVYPLSSTFTVDDYPLKMSGKDFANMAFKYRRKRNQRSLLFYWKKIWRK